MNLNALDRIAIGVANWNEQVPYGHRGVTCPRSEQEKIIGYCQSVGIHTLDTAVAYNVDLSWVPTCFDVVMKVRAGDPVPGKEAAYTYIAHNTDALQYFSNNNAQGEIYHIRGASFYDPGEQHDFFFQGIWNIPYSPFDRRWEEDMAKHSFGDGENWVRSVFVQGKVFTSEEPIFIRFRKYASEVGLPVGTLCILFCLLNPNVDKVIVGVDSEQQLRDNLRFFHRLDGFSVDDLNIIDPRKWTQK